MDDRPPPGDARMADGALDRREARTEGRREDPPVGMHLMSGGVHMVNPVTPGQRPETPSPGTEAARAFITNRLLQMHPAYYTRHSLRGKSLPELTDLLDIEPERPEGPPAPTLSYATYE